MTSGSPSSTVCSEDASDTVSSTDFASDESAGISTSRCAVLPLHSTEGRITLSSAVRFGSNVWLCVTNPTIRLRTTDICLSFNRVTSLPSKSIEPDVGFSSPVMRFNNVLLPLPERPTIATNSPWPSLKSTWSTAANGLPRRVNSRVSSCTSRTVFSAIIHLLSKSDRFRERKGSPPSSRRRAVR